MNGQVPERPSGDKGSSRTGLAGVEGPSREGAEGRGGRSRERLFGATRGGA
jgi:hypothetical protein